MERSTFTPIWPGQHACLYAATHGWMWVQAPCALLFEFTRHQQYMSCLLLLPSSASPYGAVFGFSARFLVQHDNDTRAVATHPNAQATLANTQGCSPTLQPASRRDRPPGKSQHWGGAFGAAQRFLLLHRPEELQHLHHSPQSCTP